jgi:hypothetical protein
MAKNSKTKPEPVATIYLVESHQKSACLDMMARGDLSPQRPGVPPDDMVVVTG